MHPSTSTGSEYDRVFAKHLRNSIPSLVLAAFAFATAVYYYGVIQGGVQDRYRTIVSKGFDELRIREAVPLDDTSLDQFEPQIVRKLESLSLCLRRLSALEVNDANFRYQNGLVLNRLAQSLLALTRGGDGEKEASEFATQLERYRGINQRSVENMSIAKSMTGKASERAALWLTKYQLDNQQDIPMQELGVLVEMLESKLSEYGADTLLLRLNILRACSWQEELSDSHRIKYFESAARLVPREETEKIELNAWRSAATFISDSAASEQFAAKAVDAFFSRVNDGSGSVGERVGLLSCLITRGASKEALIFVRDEYRRLPFVDQDIFRKSVAVTCLRCVAMLLLKDDWKRMSESIDTAILIAIQIQPESSELHAMFRSALDSSDEEGIHNRLYQIATNPGNVTAQLIAGFRQITQHPKITDVQQEHLTVWQSESFVAFLFKLLTSMSKDSSFSSKEFVNALKEMNRLSPSFLPAWMARANEHLELKEFAEAVQCFTQLLEKAPGNRIIEASLEDARNRMELSH